MRLETRREKALRLKKQRRSSIIGMVIVFLLGIAGWCFCLECKAISFQTKS